MITPAAKDEPLLQGEEKHALVREMFDTIAKRYDLLNSLMTFGLDRTWRARAVSLLELARGSLVLDLACGTGDLARELQGRGYRSVGLDLAFNMVHRAHADHLAVAEADAVCLPVRDGALDGIISGFALRNFSDLEATFKAAARALRAGGRLSILEVDRPKGFFLRNGHGLWMGKVVPLVGAVLSDGPAYAYLPRSIAYLPQEEALESLLEDAGFEQVEKRSLTGGVVQIVTATRSGRGPLAPAREETRSARDGARAD